MGRTRLKLDAVGPSAGGCRGARVDKFQAMLVFKTVVEQGGFTAAAKKLDISPSAATKNITGLENYLGVQLFKRSTRGIALTDHGQEFYDSSLGILSSLEAAESTLREKHTSARGEVRIVVPYSFGRVTLAPELPRFLDENPEISLDIHFSDSDEPPNLIKDGFDLAVLSREQKDSQLIQRVLHSGPVVTVATRDYIRRNGAPEKPEDLVHHNCIIGIYGADWRFKSPEGELIKVPVGGMLTIRNGDSMREAAAAGAGVAQATWWLFRKELEDGRLVRLLQTYEREAVPVSLYYPSKKHLSRRVAKVIEFLVRITGGRPPSPKAAAGRVLAKR